MVKWWMKHYESQTAKRHYAFGNTDVILGLDRGVLRKVKHKGGRKIQTVVHYLDKTGTKRYKGTSHLRKTENLVLNQLQIILFEK